MRCAEDHPTTLPSPELTGTHTIGSRDKRNFFVQAGAPLNEEYIKIFLFTMFKVFISQSIFQ